MSATLKLSRICTFSDLSVLSFYIKTNSGLFDDNKSFVTLCDEIFKDVFFYINPNKFGETKDNLINKKCNIDGIHVKIVNVTLTDIDGFCDIDTLTVDLLDDTLTEDLSNDLNYLVNTYSFNDTNTLTEDLSNDLNYLVNTYSFNDTNTLAVDLSNDLNYLVNTYSFNDTNTLTEDLLNNLNYFDYD